MASRPGPPVMAAATAVAVATLAIESAVTAAGAGVMVVDEKEDASPRLAVRLVVLPVRATEAVPIIFRNPVSRTMAAAGAPGSATAPAALRQKEERKGSQAATHPCVLCIYESKYPSVRVGAAEEMGWGGQTG
jgi:hypothetical protein